MIYNKKEFAKTIGISVDTVNRYLKNGKLPHRKIGDRVVFTEGDLKAFLDLCAVPAVNALSRREQREISKIMATGTVTA